MSKTVNVLFFARIREELGTDQVQVTLDDGATVQALLAELKTRGEAWEKSLSAPQLLVAVNQEMTDQAAELADGDEVAFFPPVTGG